MKTTPMNCQYCQTSFEAKRTDAKFCSGACKQNAYRDRMKVYAMETEIERLLQKNQFAQTINQLEDQVIKLRQKKEVQMQQERAMQLKSMNKILITIKQDAAERNIKDTNKMLKGWLEQLLSFGQQEEIYLFKIKSFCDDIIRFANSSYFTDLPQGYTHLSFINETLLPKVKGWHDTIKDSKDCCIHLQLSDELKVKFTAILDFIDG